jgi:TnsA endonuclease N terminal.
LGFLKPTSYQKEDLSLTFHTLPMITCLYRRVSTKNLKKADMPKASRSIGYRYLFTSGKIVTNKSLDVLEFESSLEKSFLSLLIFDNAVRTIKTQPHTIKWNNGRQQTRYTPDVLVEYNEPRDETNPVKTIVFEVKPSKKLENEWALFAPKFKMATKWCKKRGYVFKLVTEKYIDTPYLTNVSFLLQYDQSRFPTSNLDIIPEIELQIHEILAFQPLSIIELLQSFSSDKAAQKQVLPYVWMLIRHSKLNTDMSIPLSMKTIIWNGEPPFDYNFEQSPIRRRLRSRIITP